MRKVLGSVKGVWLTAIGVCVAGACSQRPQRAVLIDDSGGASSTAGTGNATAGTGNPTAGSGNPAGGDGNPVGGSGNATAGTGNPAGGSSGSGTFAGGAGGMVMQDDPSCTSPYQVPYANYLAPQDPNVASSLSNLSSDEKIALLSGGPRTAMYWTEDFNATGSSKLGLNDMPMRDGPRGVHQLENQKSTTWAVAEARAASFDLDLENRVGAAQGQEMLAFKYDVSLAPTMNVLRHPGWGRAQETYGEDPVLVGNMAAAFIRGMQDQGAMACPKHFAVNDTENNRGDDPTETAVNMVVDQQTLHENYTRNFEIAVEKGDPACLMAAYVKVNGTKCTENSDLLTNIVRTQWHTEQGGNWTGFVVSDWWATVANHGAASLNAGLDLEMADNNAFNTLKADQTSGATTQAKIDAAAARIVNARIKFKHNTDAYKNKALNATIVNDQGHKDLARETEEKGAVLLKNDALLPLGPAATATGTGKANVTSVIFLGPDANVPVATPDAKNVYLGLGDGGSSDTNPPYAVSFMAGLQAKAAAAGITSVKSSANAADAATADVAIIPVTMSWDDEGEGYDIGQDRADLTLSGQHPRHWSTTKPAAFINAAAAANPNVIVLLAVGSAIVMEDWMGSAKAIVQTFYPGQEGGNAVADLLLGNLNFSGKLPFTVAQNPADYPAFQNASGTNPVANVDFYHGYRKFLHDAKAPRFWFGFGMSYTTYSYGDVTLPCTNGISSTGLLTAQIPVTNGGSVAGDEIVQLYIGYPNTTSPKMRVPELKTFARVHLMPNETKTVQLQVPARDMAFWDVGSSSWQVEKGGYTVYVGPSADPMKLKQATFTVN